MGQSSSIEWTDATWNPVTGCTRVSAGCDNCYAHTLAHGRLQAVYLAKLPVIQNEETVIDPFAVRLWPERLNHPEKWREGKMIFVNSMSDLFHVNVPQPYIRRIFEEMVRVDRHIYQVLTKRPARAATFIENNADLFPGGQVPEHIWIGTSVESQEVVYRVDHLRQANAAVRFLSCEPLLGPLDLDLAGLHWIIVGGESGIGFRPMRPEWAAGIRDQCLDAGVPFFFKQWGGRTPKSKGRILDGRTWDQLPAAAEKLTVVPVVPA